MNRRFCMLALAALFALSACGGKTVKDTRTPEEIKAAQEALLAEAMAMGPQPEEKPAQQDDVKPEAAKPAEPVAPAAPPPPPPKTPLEILAEAKADRAAGRTGEALGKALEARKALPDSAAALELLARLQFETGMDGEAFLSLEEMMGRGLGGQEAVDTFVSLAAKQGNYRRAADALEKYPASQSSAEITGAVGWLRYGDGDFARASAAFQTIAATPVYAKYAVLAARIKLASGDLPGAREAAAKSAGHEDAVALILSDAERAEGRASAAEEGYRAILRRSPHDYAAKVNLGALKLGQGENKAAAELFEAAMKARPELPEAANNLGLARRALGDHEGAEKVYRQALASSPDYPPALKNLAILHEKYQGRPAEAVPLYEKYLKQLPGDKDVDRYLKAAQRAAQDLQRAADAAKAAEAAKAGEQGGTAPLQGEEEKR